MANDFFSSYFGDQPSTPSPSNDVYSSYFPEQTPSDQVPIGLQKMMAHNSSYNDLSDEEKAEIDKYGQQVNSNFGAGFSHGLSKIPNAMADYGTQALDYLTGNHNTLAPIVQKGIANENSLYNQQYGNSHSAKIGDFTGNLTASLPLMGVVGSAGGTIGEMGANALQNSRLAQIAFSGANNAAQGAAGNIINPLSADGSVEDRARQGAEFGGALGVAIPSVSMLAGKLANIIYGGGISPEIANLSNLAQNKYGINLSSPQLSNSPFLKYIDSATGKIPLSGGAASAEEQYGQLSRAVANEIGAPNLTQAGFNTARTNYGKMYDQVAGNTVALGDQQLLDGLDQIESDAKVVVGDRIQPLINLVRSKINNTPLTSVAEDSNDISTASGLMSGRDYKQLTADGTPLDNLMGSSDPNVAFYARKVGDQLDAALARSASPEDFQTLKEADIGYAKMQKLKSLALAADPEGNVTPAKIASVLRNANRGNEFGDYPDNNLKELSDIATRMKEPPSSGSVERGLAMGSMIFPAERLMNGDIHGALMDAAGGIGIMGSSRLTQSALNSQAYKNMLLKSALSDGSHLGDISTIGYNPLIPASSLLGSKMSDNSVSE